MQFEKHYFKQSEYHQREQLIKKHALEVLKWAAKTSNHNLLNGQDKTALDIGCAYGFAVDALKSLGYNALGIDISKHSTRQAKKRNNTTDFIVCDVQKGLPFKNEEFDLVTCFEVIEHLANPIKAIKNMHNVSKNTIILTTPNKLVEKPIKKLFRDLDKTHLNVKTPQEWQKTIQKTLPHTTVKIEPYLDTNLRIKNKLLFFKSLKIAHYGLDARILITKQQNSTPTHNTR